MFPEGVEPTAGMDAAEGEDLFGSRLAPKHPRLLAMLADERAATRFNNASADELPLCPEGAVLHTRHIVDEVAQSGFCIGHNASKQSLFASLLDDAFNFSFISS
ncbi:MAG: hypothetical protein WEB60_03040 [Terrimicrobiaceae bacterium]